MNVTEKFDPKNLDHFDYLKQEAKKLGNFTEEEIRELSGAMVAHGQRLCDLLRAMRNYVQNPFGKYFY